MWLVPLWGWPGRSVKDRYIVEMELLVTAATLGVGCHNCCGLTGSDQYAGLIYHEGRATFGTYGSSVMCMACLCT
jgi:hypothetical protein